MKRIYLILSLLGTLFILSSLNPLWAQNKEFWFVAPDVSRIHDDRPTFLMITTGEQPANIEVTLPKNGGGFEMRNISIPANSFEKIDFAGNYLDSLENKYTSSGQVTSKGIHIKSKDEKIFVYYQLDGIKGNQKEIFTLKGEKALGDEFYIPFQTKYSVKVLGDAYRQIQVVATEDGTVVTFEPTGNVANINPTTGVTTTITASSPLAERQRILNKGQTLLLREKDPYVAGGVGLQGTRISTNGKKIAVTILEDCIAAGGSYDPIGDQLIPVSSLGKNYIIIKGYSNGAARDNAYILATENDTDVLVNGVFYERIHKGKQSVYDMGNLSTGGNDVVYIQTTKPAYCYQQSAVNTEVGGAILPSLYSVAARKITFNKLNLSPNVHAMFLVYRKSAKDFFLLDDAPITLTANLAKVNDTDADPWMYSRYNLSGSGVTTIKNREGSFALGYFCGNNSGTSSYGYLSDFGQFAFEADTIRVCGDSYKFDGGYAMSYKWTLPNGTTSTESILTATQSGKYCADINQDPFRTLDTTYLMLQNLKSELDFPVAAFVGETKDFSIKLNPDNDPNNKFKVRYEWAFGDDANIAPYVVNGVNDTIHTARNISWASAGKKTITLKITNTSVGDCSETIVRQIIVHNYPDNVDDAHCGITPDAKEWGISRLINSGTAPYDETVFDMDVPLVGRLSTNADHISIVTAGAQADGRFSQLLKIFNGSTGLRTKTLTLGTTFSAGFGSRSIADIDRDGKTEIVVAGSDGHVRCYDLTAPEGAVNPKWTGDTPYTTAPQTYNSVNLMIGDVDGDGNAEVVVGDCIYNGQTGKLLLNMGLISGGLPFGWGAGHAITAARPAMGVLADMDGDGTLEFVAGYNIYKITLTNKVGAAGNEKPTILRTVVERATRSDVGDGFTAIADINMDGHLDVVVSRNAKSAANQDRVYLYAWDGQTGKLLNSNVIEIDGAASGNMAPSIPFIGDIDGEKDAQNGLRYPEICILSRNRIDAFGYNRQNNKLESFWGSAFVVQDGSASTTLTMFDFNQDGINELVYRDERYLRIINGSKKHHLTGAYPVAPYDLLKTTGGDDPNLCASWTMNEYPVIADVTGDGTANIVVLGRKQISYDHIGHLFIFGAEKDAQGRVANPWAPTRQVWNQYAYNVVNINNDMTVPRYQLSPATQFPGEGGEVVHPYNGFLTQQTTISKGGVPIYPTPDAQLIDEENISYSYDANTNEMTISNLTIKNVGSAPLNAPVMITVYKDEVLPDNAHKLITYQHPTKIDKNAQVTISIKIPDFKKHLSITKLIIRVNDGGDGQNFQPVCNDCPDNNSAAFKDIQLDAVAMIDHYRKCVGEPAQFTSQTTLSGSEFTKQWFKPGSGTVWQAGATTQIASLTTNDIGQYTFKATNTTTKLSVTHVLPHLSVATGVMSWRGDAIDNNWNNINNWNQVNPLTGVATALKSVPAGCATVHIPAVADNYPSFQENTGAITASTDWSLYGQPEVGSIIYHYGSETAHPHKLKYNKAYVQYNFGYYDPIPSVANTDANKNAETAVGAKKLKRDQWYAIASPLKKMASGDFSFGGYPFTWQAAHDLVTGASGSLNTVNFNKQNTANDVDLSATHNAMGLKIGTYNPSVKGLNDHKHLQTLKGVLEVPFFANTTQQEQDAHPMHSYDPISKTSTFYYFDNNTLQQLASPVGKMKRGDDDAFKFVFEGSTSSVSVGQGAATGVESALSYVLKVKTTGSREVLIGNPFMSTINMQNFKNANFSKISGANYQVYENGQWKSYSYDAINGINSLQAFVVTLSGAATEVDLHFPLEGEKYALTGTATGKIARRLQTPGAITVTATNQQGEGGDYAELSGYAQIRTVNISKLISPEGHAIPETFFVDETGNKYNLIQVFEQGAGEVSLGVKCSDTKSELTLSFDHVAEFGMANNTHPVLVDKLLGVEQDLTKNNTYRFRQHTSANSQSQYADKKRFAIRFSQDGTGNYGTSDNGLQVIYTGGHLEVSSIATVSQVEVYSINGLLMFSSGVVNTTDYHQDLPLAQGSYIVKVKTADNKTGSKKIMAR